MDILYVSSEDLFNKMDNLTYGEFRTMLPKAFREKLPKPGRLKNSDAPRLLVAEELDMTLTVYSSGLYLYREDNRETVYVVSRCARIDYNCVKDPVYVTESRTRDYPWYLPLIIVGSYRLEHNQNSRQEYMSPFHFESGIPDHLLPYTPNFVRDSDPQLEEEKRQALRRIQYDRMNAAMKSLSKRQLQVFMLRYRDGMKVKDIAKTLDINESTVSELAKAARTRLARLI